MIFLHGPRRSQILILLILVVCFPLAMFGAGQSEDKIAKAEKLIKQKEYDDALKILAEVIREEPDRFGDATSLANEIFTIRERYNKKYEDLINALYSEQDVDKGLSIIAEMESLDPNPNSKTIVSITTAKRAAELIGNLNFFTRIMDTALSQIKARSFSDAITTYLSAFSGKEGLDLHRADFKNEGYGNIVQASVDEAITGVIASGTSGVDRVPEVSKKMADFFKSLTASNREASAKNLQAFLDSLAGIQNLALKVEQYASTFKNQSDSLRKAHENAKGVLFLRYTYQLIIGRQAHAGNEGMLFALRSLANDYASQTIDKLVAYSDSQVSAGMEAYNRLSFADAQKSFRNAMDFAEPLVLVSYFFDNKENMSQEFKKRYTSDWIVDSAMPLFMKAQERIKDLRTYRDVGTIRENSLKYSGIKNTPTLSETKTIVSEIRTFSLGIGKIDLDWEKYRKLAAEKIGTAYNPSASNDAISFCANAEAAILSDYIRILGLLHHDESVSLDKEKLLLANGSQDPKLGFAVFYPDMRKVALNKVLDDETLLLGSTNAIRSEWLLGLDLLLHDARIAEALTEVDRFATLVTNSLDDIRAQISIAESNITQAKKFKELGDIRSREAQTELAKDNSGGARGKINDAKDAYGQSLNFQENSDLRKKLNALDEFLVQIQKSENERVVREVRKLIESAKDHYVKGEFEQAQDSLNAANARWNDTQTEENTEIKDWFTYVKDALLIRSERELTEKSPLYKDISQLFNLAKDDYNNAMKLIKAGKRDEAETYLASAQEKLVKITQQFPYNKDARLLILLILKETNPADYTNQFTLRITSSRAALIRGTGDLQVPYNDLKDLEALDPNYPGLKALLFDFEVRLNLRRPPPDPAKIAGANDLVEQARPIVEKRQIDLFSVARDLLNKALGLNPDNKAAKELLDNMGIYAGQRNVAPVDIQKYNQAQQLYLTKKFLEALNIANDLVTRNPGYWPFVDLLRKIKAALGQI